MKNISWCPCLKVRVNFIPRRNYAAHFTVIFSDNCALQVSVYGQGSRYGSRPLAQMKLQYCEGHVLGQVYSAVRGYVWRDKVTLPLLSIMNTMF